MSDTLADLEAAERNAAERAQAERRRLAERRDALDAERRQRAHQARRARHEHITGTLLPEVQAEITERDEALAAAVRDDPLGAVLLRAVTAHRREHALKSEAAQLAANLELPVPVVAPAATPDPLSLLTDTIRRLAAAEVTAERARADADIERAALDDGRLPAEQPLTLAEQFAAERVRAHEDHILTTWGGLTSEQVAALTLDDRPAAVAAATAERDRRTAEANRHTAALQKRARDDQRNQR